MRKVIIGTALASVCAAVLVVSGCSENINELKENARAKALSEPVMAAEETEEEETEEESVSPEQMDLIKYNYYVELNNEIVKLMDDIDYYYEVVEYDEEFALIPDSGYTYGYCIRGFGKDLADDCIQLADMEPAYETLDPLIKEMAEPLKELMAAFSEVSRSNDYAANQYQKAKELHAVIYPAADEFEPMGYEFIHAVSAVADERIAAEEEEMKAEGRLIAYNASRGISIAGQIMDECTLQGVTDDNITDLDLTKIKPLYEELTLIVEDLNAATADSNQMMKESMSNSKPFDQLYERMLQALEWMIKQVESGKPIEDPGLEPLGSIAHFSNTLSDCVDRYNTVFVD